jgi:hypothetical protein
MKFLLLSLFSLASAYTVETVNTMCFFVTSSCHQKHAIDVGIAIYKHQGLYISHSTTSTKSGMHSLIVYK